VTTSELVPCGGTKVRGKTAKAEERENRSAESARMRKNIIISGGEDEKSKFIPRDAIAEEEGSLHDRLILRNGFEKKR